MELCLERGAESEQVRCVVGNRWIVNIGHADIEVKQRESIVRCDAAIGILYAEDEKSRGRLCAVLFETYAITIDVILSKRSSGWERHTVDEDAAMACRLPGGRVGTERINDLIGRIVGIDCMKQA